MSPGLSLLSMADTDWLRCTEQLFTNPSGQLSFMTLAPGEFCRSVLSSIDLRDRQGCTMVVGSDGRYFSRTATEIVLETPSGIIPKPPMSSFPNLVATADFCKTDTSLQRSWWETLSERVISALFIQSDPQHLGGIPTDV
ncbi:hypothetical protein PANDA_022090 [Ailuropoda melanoleuca]|uniref:Uncharacterized protein n=1 Tax=Ailuropoda melanoleuca TaxID=9646 RepID=D2I7W1_AILME|nr:hypothetical protein PANDA_022090 [Ailuropoda melanoleuca]